MKLSKFSNDLVTVLVKMFISCQKVPLFNVLFQTKAIWLQEISHFKFLFQMAITFSICNGKSFAISLLMIEKTSSVATKFTNIHDLNLKQISLVSIVIFGFLKKSLEVATALEKNEYTT